MRAHSARRPLGRLCTRSIWIQATRCGAGGGRPDLAGGMPKEGAQYGTVSVLRALVQGVVEKWCSGMTGTAAAAIGAG